MRCDEFETRLNDIVDEHRHPDRDPELCSHAAACPSCEQLLRSYESLVDAVAHMDKVEPVVDLRHRVVAQWLSTPRMRSRRRVRIELALAAALLVAAVPGLLRLRSRPAPVEPPRGPDSQVGAAADALPQPALIDEAREAYQPLLVATRKSFVDALRSFPFEDAPASDAAPASDEEGTVLGDISPLAESATRSVVALFRILPGTAGSFEARGLRQ